MDFTHGSKNWLQRAILYRHKELLLGREDWSFRPGETMYTICSFFIDIFGLMCSFGLALFVVLETITPDQGMLVRSPGKSICKRLNGTTVVEHVIM